MQAQQSCKVVYEAIITLYPPRFGIPTVWDASYRKHNSMIKFADGIAYEDGTVMAVGEIVSLGDEDSYETVLARLNRRGRALIEKRYKARLNEHVFDIIETDKKEIIAASTFLGTKTAYWLRLAWYDKDGDFLREKIIKDPKYDYKIRAMHTAIDGSGFILLLKAEDRKGIEEEHGVLMRFSPEGKQLWRRAYRVGTPNIISGLGLVRNRKHYLASGSIQMDDGRMAGWVLELNHDGTVVWQRTYPRGASSMLNKGVEVNGKYILVGDAKPLDGTANAAWVLAISSFGEPLWQRYLRSGDHKISGLAIMKNEDNRLSVLLNAKALPANDQKDHFRLLTMTHYGALLDDEPYVNGFGAQAEKLFKGHRQERIVIANSESDSRMHDTSNQVRLSIFSGIELVEDAQKDSGKDDKDNKGQILTEGWVVVATSLDPYEDPCRDRLAD